MKLEIGDYPALFQAADSASNAAQRSYLRLTKGILCLLVGGAAFAAVSNEFPEAAAVFAVISAIVLAASLLLSVHRETLKLEQVWYGGRAVAETARNMMWRYVTGADPYPTDLPSADAEKKFLADLASIAKERKLPFGVGKEFVGAPQISKAMREARASNLNERKETYLVQRVQDQRRWYGERAQTHSRSGKRYFFVIVASQICALASAISLVRWSNSKIQLTGLFASVAAAFIAWLQIKQHKELSQGYAAVEMELSFIEEEAARSASERDLSDFVAHAEGAIAREQMVWLAKRDGG